jgi:hypothetical protein
MATETKKDTLKEKTVKIKIPLERGGNNEDVYVAVNGRSWSIKRGVYVEVPECVKEVLDNSEAMYQEAMAFEDASKRVEVN